MKKLIVFILCAMLICVTPVVAFAEGETADSVETGGDVEDNSTPTEESATESEISPPTEGDITESETIPPTETPEDESTQEVDIFTRIWQYAQEYSVHIMGFLSTASICVYAFYQKNKNGVFFTGLRRIFDFLVDTKDISQNVLSKQETADENMKEMRAELQVVSADVKEELAQIQEYKKALAMCSTEIMAMLEMMHIAYINSNGVPQSMKNLITAKYANCLSTINGDEELSAAFDEMRTILGIGEENEEQAT